MKKLKELLGLTNLQILLRALARLHCGLVAGILFAFGFSVLQQFDIYYSLTVAFFRGLLFALPAGLSYYAAKRTRTLWQYLLASLLLCGLSFLLTGHLGGVILTVLMCFFRGRNRLAEEEEGPTLSFFDFPNYPSLSVFAAAFVYSAFIGFPTLQRLALVSGMLYLILCVTYRGAERVDAYLTLNKTMRNLPARRIQRIAGAAVLGWFLLMCTLLIPALGASGNIKITIPENRHWREGQAPVEPILSGDLFPDMQNYAEMFWGEKEPLWVIPQWLSTAIFWLLAIALLVGLVFGIRQVFKNFQRNYTDNRDYVQYLGKEEYTDQGSKEAVRLRRPAVWDRSPNAVIRRRYRRRILKAGKDSPAQSLTPSELEGWAGLEVPRLHELYEKARYGQEPCSPAEAKEVRLER